MEKEAAGVKAKKYKKDLFVVYIDYKLLQHFVEMKDQPDDKISIKTF